MCPYLCRPLKRCRVGQGVKTPPFHGGITGSNPVRGTRSLSLRGFFVAYPIDDICQILLNVFFAQIILIRQCKC
jgi:hypothetical protein